MMIKKNCRQLANEVTKNLKDLTIYFDAINIFCIMDYGLLTRRSWTSSHCRTLEMVNGTIYPVFPPLKVEREGFTPSL